MNHPLWSPHQPINHDEPQIHQVCDLEGRVWWSVYDPMTQQMTYLKSEEDVQLWLDERSYL